MKTDKIVVAIKKVLPHLGIVCLLIGLLVISCQQEFDKTIPDTGANDSVNVTYGQPKVLYVVVDGVRGQSVQALEPPRITSLLNHAIYSWVSLGDEDATKPGTNWASLFTGVSKAKHGVIDNDFSNSHFDTYPLIYKRIKSLDSAMNIQVFTTSQVFKDHLTDEADESELLANDDAVKSAVITALGDEEAGFITAHFSNPNNVGASVGYDESKPAYKDAILTFDDELGEMLDALEARPTYGEENWLVVVTSSIGGAYTVANDDNTVFSNPVANTFTIFSAARYSTRYISKPFVGNKLRGDFIRFQGQRRAILEPDAEGVDNNSLYDLDSSAFTIELKIKKNKRIKNIYPCVLGKRPEWSSGWPTNGWVIFLENDFWQFNARGTGNGNQVRGGVLSDASWSSVAVVGVVRDGQRYVRTFTNGAFNNETNIQGWGNLNADAPLSIGYIQGRGHGEGDVYVADVRIWKAALPDDIIAQYACETSIDENHPYYAYLAGYWPVAGDTDGTIRDEGPFGSHLTMTSDDFSYSEINDYLCAPSSEDLGQAVPRSFDVPAQIFTWLKMARQESWQLDGRTWLDQ